MQLKVIPNEKEWQFFFVRKSGSLHSLLELFDNMLDFPKRININMEMEKFGIVGTMTVYSQNDFDRMHQQFQRCVR